MTTYWVPGAGTAGYRQCHKRQEATGRERGTVWVTLEVCVELAGWDWPLHLGDLRAPCETPRDISGSSQENSPDKCLS